jgi:hypothetical protein
MKDKRKMMMVVRAQKQKANRAKERWTHTQHTTQWEHWKIKESCIRQTCFAQQVSSLVQRKEDYNEKKLKVFI